ncbi:unnamed protein product [Polarella glacialis]|uniref:Uncharacterized protein n=1 Tax=Polarella glacialis TaxID=89957 RepID=A0A813FME9_POLGL|nr:unnamed protein product [Polarella glacialis]
MSLGPDSSDMCVCEASRELLRFYPEDAMRFLVFTCPGSKSLGPGICSALKQAIQLSSADWYFANDGTLPSAMSARSSWDTSGTLPGHFRDTSGTLPGHFQDTSGTLPGHFRDTSGTLPGHFRDTSGTLPRHFRDTGAEEEEKEDTGVGAEAKREVWNLEDEVLPLNRFPSMQGGRYSGRLDHVLESDSRGVPESRASIQDMGDRSKHGPVAQERACGDGKARASAYFEDLISFLEMNGLPGAYALALAANGIEDLSQLLTMGEEELDRAITRSDLDAMDEILLRDALRGVRARD